MIYQTVLATKLRRADNQPLACVLTLHNTSDIYKMSISLKATRQQLVRVHQIAHPMARGATRPGSARSMGRPRASLRFFVLSYFFSFFFYSSHSRIFTKNLQTQNTDLNLNPPKIDLVSVARKYQSTPLPWGHTFLPLSYRHLLISVSHSRG